MNNMVASFTEDEKTILKGQTQKIAAKHGCSSKYVELIIKGERQIKFPLAKKIYTDLQALVELLTPNNE